MKLLSSIILAASLFLAVLSGCNNAQACPRIGDKAPDFTLPSIDGNNISLSDYTGKPVIINTWSISCIECKREMPFFQEIYSNYKNKGLTLISVNTMDSIADARAFLSKNNYDFPVVFDYKNEIYKKFCCPKQADPNTFIINGTGTIKSIKIGAFSSKDELEQLVKTLF
jgi:peroxiredoxin